VPKKEDPMRCNTRRRTVLGALLAAFLIPAGTDPVQAALSRSSTTTKTGNTGSGSQTTAQGLPQALMSAITDVMQMLSNGNNAGLSEHELRRILHRLMRMLRQAEQAQGMMGGLGDLAGNLGQSGTSGNGSGSGRSGTGGSGGACAGMGNVGSQMGKHSGARSGRGETVSKELRQLERMVARIARNGPNASGTSPGERVGKRCEAIAVAKAGPTGATAIAIAGGGGTAIAVASAKAGNTTGKGSNSGTVKAGARHGSHTQVAHAGTTGTGKSSHTQVAHAGTTGTGRSGTGKQAHTTPASPGTMKTGGASPVAFHKGGHQVNVSRARKGR
jgi:hypothetical protein